MDLRLNTLIGTTTLDNEVRCRMSGVFYNVTNKVDGKNPCKTIDHYIWVRTNDIVRGVRYGR